MNARAPAIGCLAALLTLSSAAFPARSAPHPKAAPVSKPAPSAPSLLEGLDVYLVDAPHTSIGFTVPWMGVSKVRGSFRGFLGTILYDPKDLTRSSITLIIPTATINTDFEMRDKDLKSPNFFDVEKYPIATFSSRSIEKTPEGYRIRGDFTLHGVTKSIEIPFVDNGLLHDPLGGDRIGFEGKITLRRTDYGIVGPPRFNRILEKGIVIGEEVEIPLAIEGWKAPILDTLQDHAADSLLRALETRGAAAVFKDYRALRSHTPDSLMTVNEEVLNDLGYQYLARGQAPRALEMFKVEAESYPTSAFAQVGLGQSYARLGNREQAVASCESALRLNPRATRAIEILRRIKSG